MQVKLFFYLNNLLYNPGRKKLVQSEFSKKLLIRVDQNQIREYLKDKSKKQSKLNFFLIIY